MRGEEGKERDGSIDVTRLIFRKLCRASLWSISILMDFFPIWQLLKIEIRGAVNGILKSNNISHVLGGGFPYSTPFISRSCIVKLV